MANKNTIRDLVEFLEHNIVDKVRPERGGYVLVELLEVKTTLSNIIIGVKRNSTLFKLPYWDVRHPLLHAQLFH